MPPGVALGAGLAAILAAATARPALAAPSVLVWQSAQSSEMSEGMVEVEAAPAVIFAAVTDYAKWPSLFSDVEWTKIKSRDGTQTVVQYKSRSFGKPHTYRFRTRPQHLVRHDLVDGPSGVKMFYELWLEPGKDKKTRVRVRLYTYVGGIYGWLVSDKRVRKGRERKLRRDLVDIGKRFDGKVAQTTGQEQPKPATGRP